MPLVEDGRYRSTGTETEILQEQVVAGEDIATVAIYDAVGRQLIDQKIVSNEFDSDFEELVVNNPGLRLSEYTLLLSYWVNKKLALELSYEKASKKDDTWTKAHLIYLPETPGRIVQLCGATYGVDGNLHHLMLNLKTQDPLKRLGITPREGVQADIMFGVPSYVRQSLFVDGKEVGDSMLWEHNSPIDVIDGIKWTVNERRRDYTAKIHAQEKDGYEGEFYFPKRLDPREVKKLLSQKKPLGGIYNPNMSQ